MVEEIDTAPSEDNNLFSISIEPEEKQEFTKILYRREISILPEDDEDNDSMGYKDTEENQDNRKRKYQQKNRFGGSFKRYHIEIDDNVKPGIISMKLREALGLNEYQLPRFIYNMRSLGYPPGWLEECRQRNNSGINMYDSNGERVPNQNEEEGEIVFEKTDYDLSKIIDYPGYNVWPNADTLNETEKYNALPMYREHSKEFFIECLKKKMELLNNLPDNQTRDDTMEELEAEGINVTKRKDLVIVPALPECEEEHPSLPDSNSIGEMKDNCDNPDKEDKSLSKHISKRNKTKKKKEEESQTPIEEYTPDNSLVETHGQIKSVEFGTPALKIHSPYTKLPPPEAFSKDISDVEYFENLPNSTGKYEQLKIVLSSVRAKLSQLKESRN